MIGKHFKFISDNKSNLNSNYYLILIFRSINFSIYPWVLVFEYGDLVRNTDIFVIRVLLRNPMFTVDTV